MKLIPVLVCIFLTIFGVYSQSPEQVDHQIEQREDQKPLTCNCCLYAVGHPQSNVNCTTNVNTKSSNCGKDSILARVNINATVMDGLKKYFSQTSEKTTKPNFPNQIFLCSTFNGTWKGSLILLRSCGYGSISLNNTCQTTNTQLTLDGESATNVTACFCENEKCNNEKFPNVGPAPPTTVQPTTVRPPTKKPTNKPNGASCCHLTSYLLFAVSICSIYKYLS